MWDVWGIGAAGCLLETMNEIVDTYKRVLEVLSRHATRVKMDDAEHIPIVHALVDGARKHLSESGVPRKEVSSAAKQLKEYARSLYIRACLRANKPVPDASEFAPKMEALFDYVYKHGEYPEGYLLED